MSAPMNSVVGIEAQPARLVVCALMWSAPAQVRAALELIDAEDFDSPHREIVDTIAHLATRDVSGPKAVMGELLRNGKYHGPVRREMETAPLAGGVPEGLRDYATSHLALRFRDRTAAYGLAVATASESSSEHELWGSIVEGGRDLRRLADRLEKLRGGAL